MKISEIVAFLTNKTPKARVYFYLWLVTIGIWVFLISFTSFGEILDSRAFLSIVVLMVFILVCLFEVDKITKLPIRRWIESLSEKTMRSKFYKLGLVMLMGYSFYSLVIFVWCFNEREKYYEDIQNAIKHMNSFEKLSNLMASAYFAFPERPEAYVFYYMLRRRLLEQEADSVKRTQNRVLFAKRFLEAADSPSNVETSNFSPFFCSCKDWKASADLLVWVNAEADRFKDALQLTQSKKFDSDNRLLEMYLSIEPDSGISLERRKKEIYPSMIKMMESDKYNRSPYFPMLVDHIMVHEIFVNNTCNLKGKEKFYTDRYTSFIRRIFDWYRVDRGENFSVNPNTIRASKMMIFHLAMMVENSNSDLLPASAIETGNMLLKKCPLLAAIFSNELAREKESIAKRMNLFLENDFWDGKILKLDIVDNYIFHKKQNEWLKLRIIN